MKDIKYQEATKNFRKLVWMLNYEKEEFNEEKIIERYDAGTRNKTLQEFLKLECMNSFS